MDIKAYHQSITEEILAIRNRVRNLVKHWPSDGRYKEVILMSIIKRHLPPAYGIGTGFMVGIDEGKPNSSKQIDIIIYDLTYPTLFNNGDFIIITADAVKAVVEVKSNLENQAFEEVIKKANETGVFIHKNQSDKGRKIFNGIFSFEGFEDWSDCEDFKDIVMNIGKTADSVGCPPEFRVNSIAFNKDFYSFYIPPSSSKEAPEVSVWYLHGNAFSLFLMRLIYFLNSKSISENKFLWMPKETMSDWRIAKF